MFEDYYTNKYLNHYRSNANYISNQQLKNFYLNLINMLYTCWQKNNYSKNIHILLKYKKIKKLKYKT